MKQKIIFLVGPTAIGKTEVAIHLAKKIGAEIISCDSMQIYKGMNIITSKPMPALMRRVPHHLIDIISPRSEYNVSRYRRDALKKIREIIQKNKIPLFVGGTGLYMSILIDGIFRMKSADKKIRQHLYKLAQRFGSDYLYRKLKRIDPTASLKIHPHDTRRIIRALEVYENTGRPISELRKERKGLRDKYNIMIFGINIERDKLYKRIDDRVDGMFKSGLVREVKRLLRMKLSKTATYAIGIRELKGYFAGLYDLEEAKRLIKKNTRLYAKRQLTWFRNDKRIRWIKINENKKPKNIAERIFSEWKRHY